MPLNVEPQYGNLPEEETLRDQEPIDDTEPAVDDNETALADTGYEEYNEGWSGPNAAQDEEQNENAPEEPSDLTSTATQTAKSSLKWWVMGSSCSCLLAIFALIILMVVLMGGSASAPGTAEVAPGLPGGYNRYEPKF